MLPKWPTFFITSINSNYRSYIPEGTVLSSSLSNSFISLHGTGCGTSELGKIMVEIVVAVIFGMEVMVDSDGKSLDSSDKVKSSSPIVLLSIGSLVVLIAVSTVASVLSSCINTGSVATFVVLKSAFSNIPISLSFASTKGNDSSDPLSIENVVTQFG